MEEVNEIEDLLGRYDEHDPSGFNGIASALEVLNATVERSYPIVTEDVFRTKILNLLTHPWNPGNLQEYNKYVGGLNQPLRVAACNDKGETVVAFVVPPLIPHPEGGIPGMSAVAVADVIRRIRIENERLPPQQNLNYILTQYLEQIGGSQQQVEKLYKPLAFILSIYGKVLHGPDNQPLYNLADIKMEGIEQINPSTKTTMATDVSGFESAGFNDED